MSKYLTADGKILAISAAVLLILAAISVLIAPASDAPDLSIRSTNPNGAMALELWLERSGYEVREVLSPADREAVDVLFVLHPIVFYTEQEAQRLANWVQDGHTLIIAGMPFLTNTLLDVYDVRLDFLLAGGETLSPAAPTLLSPPFDTVQAETIATVQTEREDVVPHLFSENQPVLVSFPEGWGQVWVCGALRPFTNRGLRDSGSASLIANLLNGLPETAVIGFDEAAHGYGDPAQTNLTAWLVGTAPGWGIILAFALTMLYLTLRGRRFGRPIPLPSDQLRRESVEYIQAIGTLFRRSGQRGEILKHYEGQLRRRLSERYILDPHLEAIELVKMVVYKDPTVDEMALRLLLRRLNQRDVSEADLVKIITDVDHFLRSIT